MSLHGYPAFPSSTPIMTPAWTSMPTSHSPLSRFLSSLSHRCASPAPSSIDDDSTRSSFQFESSHSDHVSTGDEQAINDGLNNYGMIKHGLFKTCKQCLGKLRHNHLKSCDSLRPFVVPTVISDARNKAVSDDGSEGRLVVDVTPRLVTYFEVTIVKQQGQGDSSRDAGTRPNANNNDAPVPRRRRPAAAPGYRNNGHNLQHHNYRMGPQQQAPPRHLNLWRMPHRVFPPIVNLPLPLGAHGPLHQPMMHPAQALFRQQRHNLHNNNQNHQQRHECVAIGLSTTAFSPHDKMPGWDNESYGYHGDDGGIFHGRGDMIRHYGPSFGPGDTVGCGLDYALQKVFFVKNGEFLGYAFDVRREDVEGGLFPTVGVDTECPVFVNFGEYAFKFDLRGFASGGDEEEEEKEYTC
mmetsp:Transcript_20295/g.33093  ORF Transcript_20295/g.33093 Transcript_20295/m.33093 type:complete len:408 (-) Transcript_20295:163-1386(-)